MKTYADIAPIHNTGLSGALAKLASQSSLNSGPNSGSSDGSGRHLMPALRPLFAKSIRRKWEKEVFSVLVNHETVPGLLEFCSSGWRCNMSLSLIRIGFMISILKECQTYPRLCSDRCEKMHRVSEPHLRQNTE
jgi:hypothetical protein